MRLSVLNNKNTLLTELSCLFHLSHTGQRAAGGATSTGRLYLSLIPLGSHLVTAEDRYSISTLTTPAAQERSPKGLKGLAGIFKQVVKIVSFIEHHYFAQTGLIHVDMKENVYIFF